MRDKKGNKLFAFGAFHHNLVEFFHQKTHFKALVFEQCANCRLKICHQHSGGDAFTTDIANTNDVLFISKRNEIVVVATNGMSWDVTSGEVHFFIGGQFLRE